MAELDVAQVPLAAAQESDGSSSIAALECPLGLGYVEWHMRKAWAPLLYADEELDEDRWDRDPVKPVEASESAKKKKKTHETAAGLPVHSFATLMAHLASRSRNTHQLVSDPSGATFQQVSEPDAVQAEALRLLQL